MQHSSLIFKGSSSTTANALPTSALWIPNNCSIHCCPSRFEDLSVYHILVTVCHEYVSPMTNSELPKLKGVALLFFASPKASAKLAQCRRSHFKGNHWKWTSEMAWLDTLDTTELHLTPPWNWWHLFGVRTSICSLFFEQNEHVWWLEGSLFWNRR